MSERKIGFDRATLDQKILVDDDSFLVMPAIIASEIVHKYDVGWAYKPAEELEKTAWTADGRWVTILKHPDTALLQRMDDIYGRIEEPRFAKDLLDAKTKRPCRKGIRAKIKWFKDKVPDTIINQIKSGDLKDVSIGFTYEEDRSPGTWNGQKYDFIQRNIFLDHVAAPIPEGRCPGPICGIAVDSVVKVGHDPFGEYSSFEDCVSKNQDKEDPEAYCASIKKKTEDEAIGAEPVSKNISIPTGMECRETATIPLSKGEGIRALYCGEEKQVKTYLFDLEKGWNMETAKQWVVEHQADSAKTIMAHEQCDICKEIDLLGVLEASKRLKRKYGSDVLAVLKGLEIVKPVSRAQSTEDLLVEAKKTVDSARWLFQ